MMFVSCQCFSSCSYFFLCFFYCIHINVLFSTIFCEGFGHKVLMHRENIRNIIRLFLLFSYNQLTWWGLEFYWNYRVIIQFLGQQHQLFGNIRNLRAVWFLFPKSVLENSIWKLKNRHSIVFWKLFLFEFFFFCIFWVFWEQKKRRSQKCFLDFLFLRKESSFKNMHQTTPYFLHCFRRRLTIVAFSPSHRALWMVAYWFFFLNLRRLGTMRQILSHSALYEGKVWIW